MRCPRNSSFLLTSQYPSILQDADGRLPHQRREALAMLQRVAGSSLHRLLAFFDRAFAPQIAERFSNADAMLVELGRVMEPPTGVHSEAILQDIIEALGTEAARRQAATAVRLSEALKQVQRVHREVLAHLESSGVPLNLSRSGWSVVGGLGRYTLGFVRRGASDGILSVVCEAREAGDEVVLHLSGEPVYRTSVVSPTYGEQFDATVRGRLLARLHKVITIT